MSRLIYVIAGILFSLQTMAAEFRGYNSDPAQGVIKRSEEIDTFTETKDDFFILFKKHPVLYSFPKKGEQADQVRNFLKDRQKNKKVVHAEINLKTSKIYLLGDKKP